MYYLIRWNRNDEVVGIVDTHDVLTHDDYIESIDGGPMLSTKLTCIIMDTLRYTDRHWEMEEITQAEFETYRDLHGFMVIAR